MTAAAGDIATPREARLSLPRGNLAMALLVAPLVIFILIVFLWPVGRFLLLSVDNSDIALNVPRTIVALEGWTDRDDLPGEDAFAALVLDLGEARRAGRDALLAQLVNQRLVGTRFLVIRTASDAAEGAFAGPSVKDAVLAAHPGWGDPGLWSMIARNGSVYTDYYLLGSLDLERDTEGAIRRVSPERAQFLGVLLKTLWISIVVTVVCAVLAIPLAQAIVSAPRMWSRIMLVLVLFPLWTSLLVRTVIWIIVLQRNGPVNAALVWVGIVDEPLSLIYTRFSLYVAMVQVLLPIMVLSVASVMRRVPPTYMKAAFSLGASWWTAWRRVYLPMIMPGVFAGSAVVFVFALGYYVTPALVGGPSDQMISSYVAFYTNTTLNWGLAAALSVQLLAILCLCALLLWTARALTGRRPAA